MSTLFTWIFLQKCHMIQLRLLWGLIAWVYSKAHPIWKFKLIKIKPALNNIFEKQYLYLKLNKRNELCNQTLQKCHQMNKFVKHFKECVRQRGTYEMSSVSGVVPPSLAALASISRGPPVSERSGNRILWVEQK